MPVAVANNAQVTRAAMASDPGNPREAICSDRNRRFTMFARSTM
jgi:hypothetical protein